MKKVYYIIPFLFLAIASFSQDKMLVNIEKARFNLLEELSLHDQFLEPHFQDGKVTFSNGASNSSYLNYNLVSNRIYFVDQDKRAFILEGLASIALISFGRRTFIPINEKEVAEIIETYSNGSMLLLHRSASIKHSHENRGAYGTSTELAFSDRVNSLNIDNTYTKFDEQVSVEVTLRSNFIILKEGKRITLKRFRDLRKLYPSKWEDVKNFAKQNNLDLNNKEDVIALIRFCSN
jgi:hypothetical protein